MPLNLASLHALTELLAFLLQGCMQSGQAQACRYCAASLLSCCKVHTLCKQHSPATPPGICGGSSAVLNELLLSLLYNGACGQAVFASQLSPFSS